MLYIINSYILWAEYIVLLIGPLRVVFMSALQSTFGSILLVWQNVATLWCLGVALLSSPLFFWPLASSGIQAYCITPE